MARFTIPSDYLVRFLTDLLNTPSPTGDTDWAIGFVEQELQAMGVDCVRTLKGALVAQIDGLASHSPRALTAHVDTLGLMVSEIKASGRLKMTKLNGIVWPTVESEGVTVQTRDGRQYRGSIVFANGAAHNNAQVGKATRDEESLEVRIDERTRNVEETRLLGIEVGDQIYLDPRVEVTQSGYIRSRFLDDKACVACLVAAVKAIKEAGVTPAQSTTLLISNFEEVGHGGRDGLPNNLAEYVVVDMSVVGEGRNGTEHNCSVCLKDSSGPYSKRLSEKLRSIADRRGIDVKPDVYPFYSSDGSMYWQTGGSAEVALIGPGVDTSHGYERTHTDALVDTAQLVAEYMIEE